MKNQSNKSTKGEYIFAKQCIYSIVPPKTKKK